MPFNLIKKKDKETEKEKEKDNNEDKDKEPLHICPDCSDFVRGDTNEHKCFPGARRPFRSENTASNEESSAKAAAREFWLAHRRHDRYPQFEHPSSGGPEQAALRQQVYPATYDSQPFTAAPHAELHRGDKHLPPNPQVVQPLQPAQYPQYAQYAQHGQPPQHVQHVNSVEPAQHAHQSHPDHQYAQAAHSAQPVQHGQYAQQGHPVPQYAPTAQTCQPVQHTQQGHAVPQYAPTSQNVQPVQQVQHTIPAEPAQPAHYDRHEEVSQPSSAAQATTEAPPNLVGTFQSRPTTIDVKTGDNSPVFVWNTDSTTPPAVVEAGHAPRLVFPVSGNSQATTSNGLGSAHTGSQTRIQPRAPPPVNYHPPVTPPSLVPAPHIAVSLPVERAAPRIVHTRGHPSATGPRPSADQPRNPAVSAPQQHTQTHTAPPFSTVAAPPQAQTQAQPFPADQQHPARAVPGLSAQADVTASQQQVHTVHSAPALSGGPKSQPEQAGLDSCDSVVPNGNAQSQQQSFPPHSAAPATGHAPAPSTYQGPAQGSTTVGTQHAHQQQQQQQQHYPPSSAPTTPPGPNAAPDHPPTAAACTNCAHPPAANHEQEDMFYPYYMSHPGAYARPEPYYAGGLGIPYMMGMGGLGYGLGAAIFGGGWPGMSGYPYAVRPTNPYGYSNIYGVGQ